MEKTFNGKALYNPSGKASEYAKWACNFFCGCSNGCTYCYLKKGRGASVLGGDKPTLKKCFRDEGHALEVFEKELKANLPELQKHGLFFSFTTDPMLLDTIDLTIDAIEIAICDYGIPCKILTKVDFTNTEKAVGFNQCSFPFKIKKKYMDLIAFGFTLTGHDELEPGASTNAERIEAMKKLHDAGFKTFASIEPAIDFESSLRMIKETTGTCHLYKIGLHSGKKYDKAELCEFVELVCVLSLTFGFNIYWKDSLLKMAGIERNAISEVFPNCVTRDYNMFK